MDSFSARLQAVSIQFVPFVMAVVFHEFAHGLIAKRFGDTTAKDAGRLTLNPWPHVDLIGTIAFPLINMLSGMNLLIGWAKPVPIDPRRFTRYRPGLFWVSFAGPGMNFLIAVTSALVFCAIQRWVPRDFYLHEPLSAMAYVSITLNYALGIFNLIPLPPLDGSKMIESVLPTRLVIQYEKIAPYSFFILIGLMFAGAFAVLSYPIRMLAGTTLMLAAQLFGLGDIL